MKSNQRPCPAICDTNGIDIGDEFVCLSLKDLKFVECVAVQCG